MKKLVAFVLVTLLLCTAVAQAEGWREGFGPHKPYVDSPEVDLSKAFGHMIVFPQEKMTAEYACQRLYIYIPREDVQLGEGAQNDQADFTLYAANGTVVFSANMSDTDVFKLRKITSEELNGLIWGGGVCFEVRLPKSLTLGATYFVNMQRGCLVTDGGLQNNQIGGENQWRFTVMGDFGVSDMEYRRPLENGKYENAIVVPQAGDEISFDLVLGGEAVTAALYTSDGSVDFRPATYTESGSVTGWVLSEDPDWGVMFLDAQGNVLDQVEFW